LNNTVNCSDLITVLKLSHLNNPKLINLLERTVKHGIKQVPTIYVTLCHITCVWFCMYVL